MSTPRLIIPADFEKSGRDRRELVDLCNKGQLTRVHRGVYVHSTEFRELSPMQRYGLTASAFQVATPQQPVFCHATAALLWGLWMVGVPERLHVMTEAMRGGRNENGVDRHRGSMTERVQRCGSFLLTGKVDTVLQLILSFDFPYAVAICDSSLRTSNRQRAYNHFTARDAEPTLRTPLWQSTYPQGPALRREDLIAAAGELPTKAAQKRALAVINFASPLSESAGESISRAKMHLLGFPAPELQKHFILRDGSNAYTDFWFKELNLAGEFDGMGKYLRADWGSGLTTQQRVIKEKWREDQIRAQGVRFVRWDWKDIMNQERFVRVLHEAGLRRQ